MHVGCIQNRRHHVPCKGRWVLFLEHVDLGDGDVCWPHLEIVVAVTAAHDHLHELALFIAGSSHVGANRVLASIISTKP